MQKTLPKTQPDASKPHASRPKASRYRTARLGQTLALMRARMAANDDGATAIEYAMIAAGIGAAVAATVWSLGSTTNGFYASLTAMLP